MQSTRNALTTAVLLLGPIAAPIWAGDVEVTVRLKGVMGLVQAKDKKVVHLLIPRSDNLYMTQPIDESGNPFPSFRSSSIPFHVPALSVRRKSLSSGGTGEEWVHYSLRSMKGSTVLAWSKCKVTAPPDIVETGASLPSVRGSGVFSGRAQVASTVLDPANNSLVVASLWTLNCKESLTVSQAKDSANSVSVAQSFLSPANPNKVEEDSSATPLGVATMTVTVQTEANGAVKLKLANGVVLPDLYPTTGKLEIAVSNLLGDELLSLDTPTHGMGTPEGPNVLSHFRLLYVLADKKHRSAQPFFMYNVKEPKGGPFCDMLGVLDPPQ